jgi:hypothetical protein
MKHRWLYPEQWDQLSRECKERAGWQCQHCGLAFHPECGATVIDEATGEVRRWYLAACHLDHDPWNPTPRLAALCPSCHARYDYSWAERERWLALECKRHQYWIAHFLSALSS